MFHFDFQKTMQENHDLVTVYADYIRTINPQNLAHFIDSYVG